MSSWSPAGRRHSTTPSSVRALAVARSGHHRHRRGHLVPAGSRRALRAAPPRLPCLNIFVANAGTGQVTPFLDQTDEEFDAVVALNFTGTIHCCQLAGRMMAGTPNRTPPS